MYSLQRYLLGILLPKYANLWHFPLILAYFPSLFTENSLQWTLKNEGLTSFDFHSWAGQVTSGAIRRIAIIVIIWAGRTRISNTIAQTSKSQ